MSADFNSFDARDRVALDLAAALSLGEPAGQVLPPELRDRLRHHFSHEQTVELAMVIAVLVGMAKMLFAFDWVDRETSCPFPGH